MHGHDDREESASGLERSSAIERIHSRCILVAAPLMQINDRFRRPT